MISKEGHRLAWPFIAGKVKKTLKSVATLCDAGNDVVFTEWAAYITNRETGNVMEVDRHGNDYVLHVWIRTSNKGNSSSSAVSDFHRQGVSR